MYTPTSTLLNITSTPSTSVNPSLLPFSLPTTPLSDIISIVSNDSLGTFISDDSFDSLPNLSPTFLLPKDVKELVREASCDKTQDAFWGNLVKPSANASCDNNNCTQAIEVPRGASIAYPLLLFTTGIVGQIWALVYLYRTSRPNTRTVVYVMLSTLLWTDLLGKVLTTPPAILAYLSGHWLGGIKLCQYHGYVMSLIGIVTHLLVCAMAFERLLGIRHGYFYRENVTRSRVKILVKVMWVFSLLLCSLPFFGVGRFVLQFPGSWCFLDMHPCGSTQTATLAFTYVYGTINLLCLIAMVVCNVIVVGTLLHMRISMAMPTLSNQDRANRNRRHSELEIQMVFVLLVITTVFIISWGPLDIILFANSIWPHSDRAEDHWMDFLAIRLVSLNQIVNPWAYIMCRVAYRSKLCQCCRQLFVGRKFSMMEDGRRSSMLNSLRSLRKISRATKEPTPPHLRKELSSSDHNASIVDQNHHNHNRPSSRESKRDSGHGSSCAANIDIASKISPASRTSKLCQNIIESKEGSNGASTLVTISRPARSTANDDGLPVGKFPDHEQGASSLQTTPRSRRIGMAQILSHPLARVVSNKSFKRLQDEENWLQGHKRAQSLDATADAPEEFLLVVPITTRCRSDQTIRDREQFGDKTDHREAKFGRVTIETDCDEQNGFKLVLVDDDDFEKGASVSTSLYLLPNSERVLTDEDYFSSNTSNGTFLPVDKDLKDADDRLDIAFNKIPSKQTNGTNALFNED